MKKVNIIKKNSEFSQIINHSDRSFAGKYYKVFIIYNKDNEYKFGISTSKKVGNAVRRNKVKRQTKDILDKNKYKNGFKCVIINKITCSTAEYKDLYYDLQKIIEKMDIIKENYE